MTWLADGRQEEAWWRTAYLTALQVAAWSGKTPDLNEMVPARYRRPPPERTPEQKARDTRSAIRLIGAFFGDTDI